MAETWRKQPPIRSVHNQGQNKLGNTDRFGPEPKAPPPYVPKPPPDNVCPNCHRPVKPPYTLCYKCYMKFSQDPTARRRIQLSWQSRKR